MEIPQGDFRQRLQTMEAPGVRVTAGVPSAKEARDIFGRPLYRKGIQPIWLEIENLREDPLTFLPVGLDPRYFTPLEVANLDQRNDGDQPASPILDPFFMQQGMGLIVPPNSSSSGFIFSRLEEGTKSFNVDLIDSLRNDNFTTLTFFIPVPGLAIDHHAVDWKNLYTDDEWVDLGEDELIAALESQPCCVTNKSGTDNGDPINLVIIGTPRELYAAFIRAGWDETETVTRASLWKTFRSFVGGVEYRYSPVSSLYVFDRPQDVALQKARNNIHERNHLRLWMSRARYNGVPVWLGQISRDIGVRFTRKTITTHKIDPNVDETREFLLEDLARAQSLEKFGYVRGVGEVPMDQPRGNLTGDPWFSDGYRLVLRVSAKPVPFDEIGYLDWRNPHVER